MDSHLPWSASMEAWGLPGAASNYSLKKKVAGEGGNLCPLLQEWSPAPHELPAMPLFIFLPRDNSLNKLGSMGVSNLPGDSGTQSHSH